MAIKISNVTVIDNDRNITNAESATFTGTSSIKVPTGTTLQRPGTPTDGMIRYNSTLGTFEGYRNGGWGAIGGGATGGGSDAVFLENDQTVTTNYQITVGKNAMSTGPIYINDNVTVTIPDGSSWVIL